MLKWDDLRYFLIVARSGSLGAAAGVLGVDHSTVLRRIQAIEQSLETRLFVREGPARRLTAAGRDLLPFAERIEAAVRGAELQVAARDKRRSGPIRVSTPDGLAVSLMPGLVDAFHATNPGMAVELLTSNVPLSLAKREADVEIRPTRQPIRSARGRRIARIAFGIYAGRRYALSGTPSPAAPNAWLAREHWIFPDAAALPIYAPAEWLRTIVPPQQVVGTASSAVVMKAMVEQGLGLAALPCYLADPAPALKRVLLLDRTLWGELWLLTHPDLSRVARIRAFLDHTTQYLSRQRPLLEGRS
jgi:DNA-binding transcriptional LysR family regulator